MAPSALPAWRSPHDRVGFKELLAHYAQPIQELNNKFKSAFASHPKDDPRVHDDIYLLRYLLSRDGDVAAASTSIQQALDWRKENLPMIHAATNLTKPPGLSQEGLQKLNCYMCAGIYTPTSYGDIVLVIRAACANFPELVKDLDILSIYMMYLWEVCNQYCDTESRKRGYIVKLYVCNDMQGFTPNPLVMKKFGSVIGNQSKRSEFLYPQFLGMMCAVNAPTIINFIFKLISPLMSKGFADKFHIHGALTPDPSRIAAKELPLPFKGDDAAAMPSFLGGRSEEPIGFNFPNVLPPPPKKTPDDLPSAASLTTLVQVRYLIKQREKASSKDEVLSAGATSVHASSATVETIVSESATEANGKEVAGKEEPKQNGSTFAPESQAPAVPQPMVASSTSAEPIHQTQVASSASAEPIHQTQVQIQDEPDTPAAPKKGLFGCC